MQGCGFAGIGHGSRWARRFAQLLWLRLQPPLGRAAQRGRGCLLLRRWLGCRLGCNPFFLGSGFLFGFTLAFLRPALLFHFPRRHREIGVCSKGCQRFLAEAFCHCIFPSLPLRACAPCLGQSHAGRARSAPCARSATGEFWWAVLCQRHPASCFHQGFVGRFPTPRKGTSPLDSMKGGNVIFLAVPGLGLLTPRLLFSPRVCGTPPHPPQGNKSSWSHEREKGVFPAVPGLGLLNHRLLFSPRVCGALPHTPPLVFAKDLWGAAPFPAREQVLLVP